MSLEMVSIFIGFAITFVTYVVYITARFSKLEAEVRHLIDEVDNFHEIKQIVYKIHAQNELLLNIKLSNSLQ